MIHGQVESAGLVLEPFLITLIRAFILQTPLTRTDGHSEAAAHYLRGPSGGMSMIQGHVESADLVLAPLLTTLMLRFMFDLPYPERG